MKKAFLLVLVLFISVISTACINNRAIQDLNTKAKLYLDKGDYENAISRLEASIDLDGTIFETHYNLGIAYTQAEKYPEAIKTFENAIKLKPDFADAYYSMAVAQENFAKGIADGSLKEKEKKSEGMSQNDEGQDDAIMDENNPELTQAEKDQIVKLFNDSILSYETYLKKSTNEEDKDEIIEKIEYLKTQVQKYSTNS